MKTAFATWDNRIAPVLDTAQKLDLSLIVQLYTAALDVN
jgi:hypothetical protein